MPTNIDFEELLRHLNNAKAKYIVVGAYAVIFYTEPRYTKDFDIWIQPELDNAKKVYQALKKFGAPIKQLRIEDLTNTKLVYQLGMEPNRIDILMSVKGLSFETAWKNKKKHKYGDEKVYLLDLKDLMTTKRKVGRMQDQIDLENLKKIFKKKKKRG